MNHRRLTLLIFALYVTLIAFGIARHEPWRDEAQVWLAARDAPSFGSLVRLLGYEGTPGLVYFLLVPFTRLGLPLLAFSLLHAMVATASAVLLLTCAPMPRSWRIGAAFGYLLAYEYAIVARTYTFTVLALFALAALHRRRIQHPIPYAVILVLLANTNLLGFLLAGVLGVFWTFDLLRSGSSRFYRNGCAVIVILGLTAAVIQIIPPSNPSFHTSHWDFSISYQHLMVLPQAVTEGLLNIPLFSFQSIASVPAAVIATIAPALKLLGIPLYILALLVLPAGRPRRIFFLGSVALLALFFLRWQGSLRHHGMLLMLLFYSLWIAGSESRSVVTRVGRWFIPVVLLAGLAVGAYAYALDAQRPYSAGPALATFLRNQGFADGRTLIASYPSAAATSALPYLPPNSNRFYQLEYGRLGSYMVMNQAYYASGALTPPEVVRRLDIAAVGRLTGRVLLITNSPFPETITGTRFILRASFTGTIVGTESLYVYERVSSPNGSAM